jgi:hypothetical protein
MLSSEYNPNGMPYRVVLDWPAVVIGYDSVNSWVYANWRGPQNRDTVHQVGEQLLHFLQENKCCKILNDTSNVTMPWRDEDSEWVAQNLMPRLAAAGLQYMAWVYSASREAHRSIDLITRSLVTPMVMAFEDLLSACVWLGHHCQRPNSSAAMQVW